ncbi:MAG: ATP-binding protein [Prevotella sp.]|jgi:sigma-B regulation protein RsbU (phosphoserine phosphatase)|nr:ATP-binding protein [Prevotella sp.]MBR3078521.1 ATP-binding protein [Prevotella sp.]
MTELKDHLAIEHELTLPNDIDTIPQLSEFIECMAEEAGLDMAFTMSLNLAIEEAVVNVMTYAYPEGTTGMVNILMKVDGQQFTCILKDSGTPFDPTLTPEADTSLSAEERPIGGLGIHLVRQIMDNVSYEYSKGQNVLTLTKRL